MLDGTKYVINQKVNPSTPTGRRQNDKISLQYSSGKNYHQDNNRHGDRRGCRLFASLKRSLNYKILNLDKGVSVLYSYLMIIPNYIDLTLYCIIFILNAIRLEILQKMSV